VANVTYRAWVVSDGDLKVLATSGQRCGPQAAGPAVFIASLGAAASALPSLAYLGSTGGTTPNYVQHHYIYDLSYAAVCPRALFPPSPPPPPKSPPRPPPSPPPPLPTAKAPQPALPPSPRPLRPPPPPPSPPPLPPLPSSSPSPPPSPPPPPSPSPAPPSPSPPPPPRPPRPPSPRPLPLPLAPSPPPSPTPPPAPRAPPLLCALPPTPSVTRPGGTAGVPVLPGSAGRQVPYNCTFLLRLHQLPQQQDRLCEAHLHGLQGPLRLPAAPSNATVASVGMAGPSSTQSWAPQTMALLKPCPTADGKECAGLGTCSAGLCTCSAPSPNANCSLPYVLPGVTGVPASSATVTLVSGQAYSVTPVLASGSQPVTWALSARPQGMTVNQTTGKIQWQAVASLTNFPLPWWRQQGRRPMRLPGSSRCPSPTTPLPRPSVGLGQACESSGLQGVCKRPEGED